jgi:O-antigen/teichoic acid export membrane protein
MLSDLGLGPLASQSRRGNEPAFLNALWLMQIARGAVTSIVALVLAGLLTLGAVRAWLPPGSAYADPRVPSLIACLAVVGIVDGLQSTRLHWARRNLFIGAATRLEMICQAATMAFVLAWASIEASIWALAAGWIFGAALRAALSHAILPGPPNRFEWDRAAFAEVKRIAGWVLLSSPLTFLVASGDRLLLGGYLDTESMGLYSIATLLVAALQGAIGRLLGAAVQPALCEVVRERPGALKATLYRIRAPLDIAALSIAGALFMLGDAVVGLLYDHRYAGAGWMLSWVALTLAVLPLGVMDQCLIAQGRMKRLGALNAARVGVLFVFVPVGHALFGTRGAVAGVAAAALATGLLVLVVQRSMGLLDLRRELKTLPFLGAGLCAGLAARLLIGS